VGLSTKLEFAEGEETLKWYSGDAEAFALFHFDNFVFFKPLVEHIHTNLQIVTNKRSYNFNVHTDKRGGYYSVRFLYPEDAARKAERDQLLANAKEALDPKKQERTNIRYIGAGSDYIRPAEVFDNGTHTYFYFPERLDFPSVFRVRRDKQEVLTQSTVVGNWLVVPRVQKRWSLRLGEEVLCVVNVGYSPHADDNETHTVIPETKRVDVELEDN
jgi:type IV secretion system protein VirB9